MTLGSWAYSWSVDIPAVMGATNTAYPQTYGWFSLHGITAYGEGNIWGGYASWNPPPTPGALRFWVETSSDRLSWFTMGTSEFPVGQGQNIIHFETRRPFFRIAWRQDAPNGNFGAPYGFAPGGQDYFAPGQYTIDYVFGAYNVDDGIAGNWEAATTVTNGHVVEAYLAPATGFSTEAAVEAYYGGYTYTFQHEGGPIGIQASNSASGGGGGGGYIDYVNPDQPYGVNPDQPGGIQTGGGTAYSVNGSSGPTWMLSPQAQVTFEWQFGVTYMDK